MGSPDFRIQCSGKKIGNVSYAFPEAYKLLIKQARLRLAPEQITGMAIMMNEYLRRVRKKMHYIMTISRITDSRRIKGPRYEFSGSVQPQHHQRNSQGSAQAIFHAVCRCRQPVISPREIGFSPERSMNTGKLFNNERSLCRCQGFACMSRAPDSVTSPSTSVDPFPGMLCAANRSGIAMGMALAASL